MGRCMHRWEVTRLKSRLVGRRKNEGQVEGDPVAGFRKSMAQQCVTVRGPWQTLLSTAKRIIMFHTHEFNSEKLCQRRKRSWEKERDR